MGKNRKKIFLLDDDASFLSETKTSLEELGYEVSTCDKVLESIIAIRECNPDCLVLDLKMPHLDGEAFMPWVRRQFPDLAVIICTAKGEIEKEPFLKLGVRYFIQKPFAMDLFCNVIEKAITEQPVGSAKRSAA